MRPRSGPLSRCPPSPRKRPRTPGLQGGRRWGLCPHLALAFAALALSASARADDTTVARRAAAAYDTDRPHTIADANTGFLLLPGALVCPESTTNCKRGEFSIAVGLQNVYRFGPFGIGAGIQWAATLRSDAANGDPNLVREHSRSYFLVEGQFRYYFLRRKLWEFWATGTAGLVVVNDSWSNAMNRDPVTINPIAPVSDTLGTEGLTIGAGACAEWTFLPNWSFGPSLLYSSWFLPNTRLTSPTLDVASLAGRLDVIDVGIRIAYHISL